MNQLLKSCSGLPAGIIGSMVVLAMTLLGTVGGGVAAAASVYVDDGYAGLTNGTWVDWPYTGAAGAHTISNDAFATIQAGMNKVAAGDTVNVAAGAYAERLTNFSSRVALVGAGSGTNPATDTIVNATGGAALTLNAGGTSAVDRLVVANLRLTNISHGVYVNNQFIDYITLNNIAAVGGYGVQITGTTVPAPAPAAVVTDLVITNSRFESGNCGVAIEDNASVNGLIIVGSVIANKTMGITATRTTTNRNTALANVTIVDTVFSNIAQKGMYIEKLSDTVVSNVLFHSCGIQGGYSWPAGVDINLKFAAHQNIQVLYSMFVNCGTSHTANGFGLGLKARDDGATYGVKPATLDGATVIGCVFTNCMTSLRFGEPNKSNATPLNAVASRCSISGSLTNGLDNQTLASVDARTNWWGAATGPGLVGPGGGDKISSNAPFSPWLGDGMNTQPATRGFYPNLMPLYAVPTRLAYVNQPGNAHPGVPFPSQPVVFACDADGNLGIHFAADVAIAIGANPGGGTLSGTTPIAAANGVAAFTNLSIDNGGVGYTLVAATPGLTSATSDTFAIIINPAPVLTGIYPACQMAGADGFTLTVNGSGLVTNSVVQWNGAARATTYGSATQLTAAILAADIATPGTAAVTVNSPAPGGGTSAPQAFTIYGKLAVVASDGLYAYKVALAWNAAIEATGYQVWRYTANDSSWATPIGTTSQTNYNDSSAVAGVLYYYWVRATNASSTSAFSSSDSGWRANTSFCADLDGDGIVDLVTVVGANWYVWFSSAQYLVRCGPYNLGVSGISLTGDVDGDGLADLITVVGANWYVWFSTMQYLVQCGPYDLGVSGIPVTGDIDGDGLDDLLVVVGSNWHVWFSASQYLTRSGPYDLGISGTPVTGDIDGDGLDDLLVVVDSNWYVWFSALQYLTRYGPYDLGISGTPATGDIDGDGLADLISVVDSNWYAWFSTSQYLVRYGPYPLSAP